MRRFYAFSAINRMISGKKNRFRLLHRIVGVSPLVFN